MTTTKTPTLQYVMDAEGTGECSECDRSGLRWIAVLSTGQHVGLECAKKVMGWKPTPKTYNWLADYRLVSTHVECAGTSSELVWALWQHKEGTATRDTRGGALNTVGGARQTWEARGWL